MVKKVVNKGKVAKKPVSKKPKGKVVKATNVEDVSPEAIEEESVVKSNSGSKSLDDGKKITKALSELKKFVVRSQEESESSKTQLFEDELSYDLQIIFTKKDLFTSKKNFKPKLIHIQDKPQPETKPNVILFIRDDVINKDLLEEIENSELNDSINQIITGAELKTTYKQYEKRRELHSTNDLFLADDSLITNLPKLLGKTFYDSNKIPIPIKINKEKFSIQSTINQINKVLNSIVYFVPRSNNLSINLGPLDQINESIISQIINHFANEKLRSIFIKTNQSPSLPLYELDTVYSSEDVKTSEPKAEISNVEKIDVEGLPENIKLSEFEKGLIELADPSEIPQLFSSKIKKSIKQAKREQKAAKNNKIVKPAVKGKKQIKKVKA